MKKLLTGLFLTASIAFVSAQKISFDKTTYEYGTVKAGSDGHRYFTVTNIGDKPLIISEVKPSCGCTTPEWSKDPILPGQSTKIKVGYNTSIKGAFNKLIEVYSNDPENSRSVIYIKGVVEGDAADTKAVEAKLVAEQASTKATATPLKVKAEKVAAPNQVRREAKKVEAAK